MRRRLWYRQAFAPSGRSDLHEILEHLPRNARVLDLGCRDGSFPAGDFEFLTVRVDLSRPSATMVAFVQADAVRLPFPSRTFDSVILNHGLEHFDRLKPALQEIGRVVKREGAAFVSVPDARTVTDRIYRKVFRSSGGHVNLFGSAAELEKMLVWYFGLPHVATRTLFSSLSFLNRRNTRGRVRRAQMRFRGFAEPVLLMLCAGMRTIDRLLTTRTSVYGWAFYFGHIGETVDVQPLTNVCIRCGQAHPSQALEEAGRVRGWRFFKTYRCPGCGAPSFFSRDRLEQAR
jgi:SAM-dependent methyltransferase